MNAIAAISGTLLIAAACGVLGLLVAFFFKKHRHSLWYFAALFIISVGLLWAFLASWSTALRTAQENARKNQAAATTPSNDVEKYGEEKVPDEEQIWGSPRLKDSGARD